MRCHVHRYPSTEYEVQNPPMKARFILLLLLLVRVLAWCAAAVHTRTRGRVFKK